MDKDGKPELRIILKKPAECSNSEKDAFCDIVVNGGEVKAVRVRAGVNAAERLALAYARDITAATGCLKNPKHSYRQDVFQKSGSKLDPKTFPFEVGYVVVQEDFRGQKLSTRIVGELIKDVDARLFATSHDHKDKFPMHAALRHHGFVQEGNPYPSEDERGKMLLLFVRDQ